MPIVAFSLSINFLNPVIGDFKMADTLPPKHTNSWPELAAGLFDHLTGRGAEITYDFQDMRIKVPSGTGAKAEHAEWVLSGSMKIRTKDQTNRPN